MRISLVRLLILAASLQAGSAAAEVRHCVAADGREIFTDRACAEVDAVERPARRMASPGARLHAVSCARNVDELVTELTMAIQAHDANRLAGLYHWPGLSSQAGYQVLNRLDAIANRPLVDVVPVLAAPAVPAASGAADTPGAASAGTATADALDANYYPQLAASRPPVALRVEQTLGGSATPSQTTFDLTRHFGCWWLRL